MFKHAVDSLPEINKPLSAKYLKCFAYPSFKERVPGILQGVINDLKSQDEIKSKLGENAVKEIDAVVEKIQILITEITTDQPLSEVNAGGAFSKDAAIYNKEIKQRQLENAGNPPSWFQTEWLFAECYCYFKLHEIFYTSTYLNKYDPFLKLKIDTLLASRAPVLHLSEFIVNYRAKKSFTENEKKELFIYLLKCSLWGNKADLSLSGGKPVSTDGNVSSEMSSLDSYIISNDLEEVYQLLNAEPNQTIGIILDNAGFELFNDLCFADYLVRAGFAKKVVFHGKAIPWFVSDVTQLDFDLIFDILPNKMKSEHVVSLVQEWTNYLKNDQWAFKAESFWTLPYDFSKMSIVDPDLYATLAQYKVAIFKGDLNYRKLVGDIYWEPTTSFKAALRGFEPTNVLGLRTIKSDSVTGLKKGVFEELFKKNPNWFSTGEYALVQLLKK